MEATITKVMKVSDKAERLALQPKVGHMAVQRDVHERYFFDGYRWRLWKPGTSRHWLPSGKPKGRQFDKAVGRQGEVVAPEPTIKKKKTNPYLIAGVIALAITIILLINII